MESLQSKKVSNYSLLIQSTHMFYLCRNASRKKRGQLNFRSKRRVRLVKYKRCGRCDMNVPATTWKRHWWKKHNKKRPYQRTELTDYNQEAEDPYWL